MLNYIDEEERKRREEEFDRMFNNTIVKSEEYQQRAKEFDSVFGNNSDDYEKLANRFDEIFGNKINPKQNIETPKIENQSIYQVGKNTSTNSIEDNNNKDLYQDENVINKIQEDNDKQQNEATIKNFEDLSEEQKAELQEKINQFKNATQSPVNNGNLKENTKMAKEVTKSPISLASAEETKKAQFITNNEINTIIKDKELNEKIEKGGMDAIEAYIEKTGDKILNSGRWIKDTALSTLGSFIAKGYGLGKTLRENYTEKTEMIDKIYNQDSYKAINDVKHSSLGKPALYIEDTIQDTVREGANAIIDMGNKLINFVSFGLIKDNIIPELQDNSALQDSEKYGHYSSQEELTQSIQDDVTTAYKYLDIYNPSANKIGDVISDVALTILLNKAGLKPTSSAVITSTFSTLGETGDVKETTKSAVTSYIFSKVLNSNKLNTLIKEPTRSTTQDIIKKAVASNPEIVNTPFKQALFDTLPEITSTFTSVGVSRLIANEANAILTEGIDTFNGEIQKNIIADTIIWSTISAASEGYSGVNFKLNSKALSKVETQKQLDQWYETLELDSSKQYNADDIKKQYRNLAKKYHSDVGGSDSKMIDINLAYEGINKYLKDNIIYTTEIRIEPTNQEPNTSRNSNGLIIKDNTIYVKTDNVMNSVAKSIANTQIESTIAPIKNNENQVIGFENIHVIPFEVKNSKIPSINPAITVGDDETINVIDMDTGTQLLTNFYDVDMAIERTTKALQNSNFIQDIEESIKINKLETQKAITTMTVNLQNGMDNFIVTNNQSLYNQDSNADVFNNNIRNYTNIMKNELYGENNANKTQQNSINKKNKPFEDIALEAMENGYEEDNINSPLGNRNIETIGKQKNVKAYQYENPEVRPYFQEMAEKIGEDLGYVSSPDNRTSKKGGGTELGITTKAIDILHKEHGYSYNQISQGLKNIIDDSGKENNSISKKLEIIIDDQLRNGYVNSLGKFIEPNQEYNNLVKSKQGQTNIEGNEVRHMKKNNGNITQNNETAKRMFKNEIENHKIEIKQKNKISGNVLEINTNIFDGISKKKQSSFLNEYLKNEVKGHDYYVDGEKIIANGTTIGKLKNGTTNFDKKIDISIRNELKANIITNLDNIISSSKIYQADRPDTKSHSFANTFDRRKSYFTYKGNGYEVMYSIGKKNGVNTLYSIDNIKKIGNITSGISQKETSKTPNKVDRSNVPKQSIPQKTQNVKTNKSTVNNKSMQNSENNTQNDGIRYLKKSNAEKSSTQTTDSDIRLAKRTTKKQKENHGYEIDENGYIQQPKVKQQEAGTPQKDTNEKDIITEEERQKLIKKSKTNGEREDAFIEQAIQNVFQKGDWDENIAPITTNDIVDFINNFWDNKIEKGHFRQKAYALYKEKSDIIRTASLGDIDSITHEVFHRIFHLYNMNEFTEQMYDEVVTEELVDLYNNLLGKEEDLVNEGFAEFGRRYIVQKDWVEKNMPNTVEALNKRRAEFPQLDEFINTLQNKVHDYIYQEPGKRASKRLSFAPKKEQKSLKATVLSAKNVLSRELLNKDYALEFATDYFAKGLGYVNSYELKDLDNPVILNALKNGMNDKIDSILNDGIIDLETGEKLCDGLADIGKLITDTQEYKDFLLYLSSLRSVEANETKGKTTGIRYDDAKYIIDKYKNNEKFKKGKDIYQKFNNTLLDQLVKSGLYSQEDIEAMQDAWENYVPFLRVMDNENQGGTGSKNPIKHFKGSEREIINPIEGTIIMLGRLYPAMNRNLTMQKFVELGEESGLGGVAYDIIPNPLKHIGTEKLSDFKSFLENQGVNTDEINMDKTYELFYPDFKDNPKERITSYKVKGKEVTIQFRNDKFSKDLYEVFTANYSPDVPNMVQKIFKTSAGIFRYGTTIINPTFAMNNISSDTQQASINAKGNFIPYLDSAKGMADVIIGRGISQSIYGKLPQEIKDKIENTSPEYKEKIKKYYSLYKQSGASGGSRKSLYTNRKESSKYTADIMNKNYKDLGLKKKYVDNAIDILSSPSELSEEGTKFEVFVKDMEKLGEINNENIITAAYNARNATQDFSTSGKLISKASQYIPYLSAKVGSIENSRILYKQLIGESAREYKSEFANDRLKGMSEEKAKINAQKKVVKVWKKKVFMTALFTALGYLVGSMYKDDDSYEEINDQKKKNNFYIKIGDNWLKIKKAQGETRLWINMGEYLAKLTSGNMEDPMKELGNVVKNSIEDTGFSDDVSSVLPPLLATVLQLKDNRDYFYDTAIVPQYMMDSLEPKDWYNEDTTELSKMLGQTFNVSPMGIDFFVKNTFGTVFYNIWSSPDKLLGLTDKYPAKTNTSGGAFFVNPYSSSNSVNEVYTKYEEYKRKSGSGTLTSEEEIQYGKISEAVTSMGKINKQIKEIKADLTEKTEQKEPKIIELQKLRTDIARQSLGKETINSSSKELESVQFYPSTNSLSQNNYSLELNSDMKKEYEKLASDFYKKYEKQGLYNSEYSDKIKNKAKDYAKSQMFQKYKANLVKTK